MLNIVNQLMNLRLVKDTKGQDLIEYAMLAGLIAVVVAATMPNLGGGISSIFGQTTTLMANVAAGAGS